MIKLNVQHHFPRLSPHYPHTNASYRIHNPVGLRLFFNKVISFNFIIVVDVLS